MPITVAELESAANAAIEYHMDKGKIFSQTVQDKPWLTECRRLMKTFPGGKDNLTVRVKGAYTTTIQGFEYDDTVTYANPANIREAKYPWKLIHSGIEFTKHELLTNGISISNSMTGAGGSNATQAEKVQLANILDDKIEDMVEGTDRGMNDMFWRDGTQDAKVVPGLLSIITDVPTAAVAVGGIDQSTSDWWRNRAVLGIAANLGNSATQVLAQTLQREFRQLRRYGSPKHKLYAGSDFLDQLENELRAKGEYTQSGWAKSGGQLDLSVGDAMFKGMMVEYDPTLDDLGYAKRMYAIDTKNIYPMVIDGENMQRHNPARPEDKYVFYRALTWVGGLVCRQRNTSGVYSIA
jgi:hypothetical protein